jgi:hypothetical protein
MRTGASSVSSSRSRAGGASIIDDYGDAGHVEEVLVLDMLATDRVPSLQGLGAVNWHAGGLPEIDELLAA